MASIPMSRELMVSSIRRLQGYLPFYKPKGVNLMNACRMVVPDIRLLMNYYDTSSPIFSTSVTTFLEPFADGVATIVLNQREKCFAKHFAFANYQYRVTIEFGAERQYNTIDGELISRSNVDHIEEIVIKDLLTNCFSVRNAQKRTRHMRFPTPDKRPLDMSLADYYRHMRIGDDPQKTRPPQKYPYLAPDMMSTIEKIELVSYNKPFGEFFVSCQGSFKVAQFAADLAAKLNTTASLVQMTRLKEGPMTVDDIRLFKLHELNVEEYFIRIRSFDSTYRRFNAEMAELCGDIKT